MKKNKKLSPASLCVHSGSLPDAMAHGVNSPIFPSTAFRFLETPSNIYPRYFNTPNQEIIARKIAELEHGEEGMVFSSGMAAITHTLLALLERGDHVVCQQDLYGGTHYFIVSDLVRWGIRHTFVDGTNVEAIEKAILPETKLIFVETPSNPLLKLTDLSAVAHIAKKHNLLTMIDNTFATPVHQNPIDVGIDIVMHSGTKYLGGHSDLMFGAIVTRKELMKKIHRQSVNLGGNLNALDCHLIERSIKTLFVRMKQQSSNALAIAQFLVEHPKVACVNYPGLPTHPDYELACRQMKNGFGAMLSFEVKENPLQVVKNLSLIAPALSLGGVESTITIPATSSHSKLTAQERERVGIKDTLLRLSVGIEEVTDLIADLEEALC
ncbi:MAG: PLP-dependent aspartate aminotransferase family protein [Flammeovirgaceae bacterium]|nr:PLP-dependent aspartate aminotransferase family protein [Flammeovirgaceae bacterium]MDW8287291.1 aminotransferase class I/II-fold pyridoxal phosphate-dependent enzyme [Flammeovirgaceae bacterium]